MKFKTAASIAALAMVTALAPGALSQGVQPDQKAPPPQMPGQGAQPDQKAPPPQIPGQRAQPDQKAPPQAERQGSQKDQTQAAAIPARQPDMVLVSNLLNASVYGPGDSTIGEIEDILIKSDGKIEGLVVSVGGFLGLGEKNVALKMDRFKVMPEADGRARITVSATEQELREAPEFKTKQGQAS
jgi:sporulation protein YlmC with PRC-barrel domain